MTSLKAGDPGTGITTDIFGVTRLNPPTIGAYELPAYDAGITGIVSPGGSVCSGTTNITVTLSNFGTNTITSDTLRWSLNGVTQPFYPWTGSLAPGASINVTVGTWSSFRVQYTQ